MDARLALCADRMDAANHASSASIVALAIGAIWLVYHGLVLRGRKPTADGTAPPIVTPSMGVSGMGPGVVSLYSLIIKDSGCTMQCGERISDVVDQTKEAKKHEACGEAAREAMDTLGGLPTDGSVKRLHLFIAMESDSRADALVLLHRVMSPDGNVVLHHYSTGDIGRVAEEIDWRIPEMPGLREIRVTASPRASVMMYLAIAPAI